MNNIEEFDDFGDLEEIGAESLRISMRKKMVDKWIALSGLDDIPPYSVFESKAENICIADIGVFSSESNNTALIELQGLWRQKNIIRESNIKIKDVEQLGHSLLNNGKFPYPLVVVKIKEDESYQCLYGFEYLVVLALLYDVNEKISVVVQKMNLSQAKRAFEFLNSDQSTKVIENKVKKSKTDKGKKAEDMCEAMFLDKKNKFEFDFKIGIGRGRKKGTLTSLTAIKMFWSESIGYRGNMKNNISKSIDFLNAMVARGLSKKHLLINSIIALGRIYNEIGNNKKNPQDYVDALAEKMLGIDDIDKQKTKDILNELKGCVK